MLCNELYDGQGLGNQLWNYAVTRILAKQNKTDFSILGRQNFKGKGFMELDFGAQPGGGISPDGGPPYRLPKGITNYYRERRENWQDTQTDISRTDEQLYAIHDDTKFDGNCQSTKYLAGHRQDILKWIKIRREYHKYTTPQDVCVIHMRCGDFAGLKDVFLPPEYYKEAMRQMKKINPDMKFYCVTDQGDVAKSILPEIEIIGSALFNKEDQNMASHHHGGPIGIDFSLLLHAQYLIIPNSSFSWWAAYLNTHKKVVIAPKYWARYNTSDGFWATADIITDDFTYLDKSGKLFSSERCWAEKDAFEAKNGDAFIAAERSAFVMPSQAQLMQILAKQKVNALKNTSLKNAKKLAVRAKNSLLPLKELRRHHAAPVSLPQINHTDAQVLSDSEIAAIGAYRKTIKIYDVFTFFNELELLEMHLNILAPYVDYFVIIECTQTFSGNPKPLTYQDNRDRFKKFERKIIHYVTDDVPDNPADLRRRLKNANTSPLDKEIIELTLSSDNIPTGQIHWFKEFYQKESIRKALATLNLADNDICYVGDVDEVWNPKTPIDYTKDDIYKLRQDVYAYYLNNRSNEPWAGTLVSKYKNIKNNCLNHLRTVSKTKYTYVKNGGWHFTNQGGADQIRKKLESYGHQEFNNDEIKSDLENKMRENKDFVGRHFTFHIDESGLPDYIKKNKSKYKKFFK